MKCTFWSVLVLIIVLASSAHAQWSEANGPYQGPYDGRSYCFTTLGLAIFTGSDSGVWKSLDSGHSWVRFGAGLEDSYVYQLSAAGPFLFAATFSGIFRSVDTGRTWHPSKFFVGAVVGQYWFASGDSGIYRSSDQGTTWTVVKKVHVLQLASGDNVIYALTDTGCIRSVNSGASWDTIFINGNASVLRANGKIICIGTMDEHVVGSRIYPAGSAWVSPDKGNTWFSEPYQNVWDHPYDFVIMPTYIIAGWSNTGFHVTTNDSTWTTANGNVTSHLGNTYGPSNTMTQVGNKVIVAFSADHIYDLIYPDTNWHVLTDHSDNIPESDRYIAALAAEGSKLVAITMNGNLYRTLDSGVNWKYITTLPLVLDTGYSSLISHDGKLFAGFDSGIAVSTDFGATWKTITVSGASIVPIITDGNRLIAGGQGVYVSSDGGTTWIALLGRPPGDVRTITVLGQRLFASTQWGLFESVDNGTHWNKVDVPLFEYPYLVNAVFADSSNLLVGADQIYLSNDEGTTWTNPVMNVPNGARAVNFYTKIGGLTVAGLQYYSLDYSFDNGITWENDTTIYKQYARAVVADSSRLYLGCQGGVFRRSMVTAQLSVAIAEAPNVEVSVYPNPATGVLTISNVPENLESISILNVLGVQMMEISKQSAREFQIDISKLPEGVYYAKFAIGGSTFTRKILKQR